MEVTIICLIIIIVLVATVIGCFIHINRLQKASKDKVSALESKISALEFELSLPNIKINHSESDSERCSNLKCANILIVDDNLINQKIMTLSLQKIVNSIDTANNGREAVEKFKTRKYDIIFMDIQMPEIDGIQATKIIREIEVKNKIARTPIIANIVGKPENCSDFDDFYGGKPFSIEKLINTMNNLLTHSLKKIVILTGAGISKESGIDTFRDLGGIWEQFDFMEVCHINGWNKNPLNVLNFMNSRRSEYKEKMPNDAHRILAELEEVFDVTIITQNIDDLHERGGSSKIIHLHGEMTKARSSIDPNLIIDVGYKEIKLGDKAPDGSQLRPHVVMFGETVPIIQTAIDVVKTADIFVIIGTSLNVYPASKLINVVKEETPVYLIDPNEVNTYSNKQITIIQEVATIGTRKLKEILIENHVIE